MTKKKTLVLCLRCGGAFPPEKFTPEEGSNYHVHNVCNECREFMTKRANFLIKSDKRFHTAKGMDFEVTSRYRHSLVISGTSAERVFK